IGHKQHGEPPSHEEVNTGQKAKTNTDSTQQVADETRQQQLAEGQTEPGEGIADGGGLAADAFEEDQRETAQQHTVQEQVTEAARGVFEDQADQPNQSRGAAEQAGIRS